MKEKGKWTPHIIAAAALVVFIVLGLASASTPSVAKIPADFVPEPKSLGLSQAEMGLNDPRMPPDIRIGNYWLGTWAPGLSEDQVSIFELTIINNNYKNFRIDGNLLGGTPNYHWDGFLYLAPGKHAVSFSYYGGTRVRTGIVDSTGFEITVPNVRFEIDMQPGIVYRIWAEIKETARSELRRNVFGYSSGQFTVEFTVNESDWKPKTPSTDGQNKRKFLEPYDPSIPVFSQAFLETRDNIYIVGFDGKPVRWGWGVDSTVTIGVPSGSHTLQFVRVGDNTLYTTTINCVPGSRYVFWYSREGVFWAVNATRGGSSISVTKTNETFNAVASQPAAPITFDGPTITIVNDLGKEDSVFRHLYISPSTDANWGPNRIKPGQVFKGKGQMGEEGDSIAVQLPYPLSTTNQYDIMWIYYEGSRGRLMNVEITADSRILMSRAYRRQR
jgi:hypothetical protein